MTGAITAEDRLAITELFARYAWCFDSGDVEGFAALFTSAARYELDGGRRFVGHANFQPIAHAIRNPVELMGAIASVTTGGILERHPRLRCAFLEGTAGWLSWWLWRLDDQWEKFGPGCEHQLSMPPSEYFKRQAYVSVDCDEAAVKYTIDALGSRNIVFSTDFPHSDARYPHSVDTFLELPISDADKQQILWDNCAALYGMAVMV